MRTYMVLVGPGLCPGFDGMTGSTGLALYRGLFRISVHKMFSSDFKKGSIPVTLPIPRNYRRFLPRLPRFFISRSLRPTMALCPPFLN
jgi:hypothetical protein